jgi:hypothetical protein
MILQQDRPQNPQLQYPGAYAVRGMNAVPNTENDHQAIGVNDDDGVNNITSSITGTTTDSNTNSRDDSNSGSVPSSSQLMSRQSSKSVVLVASVVDEEETERSRLSLIAETEARVRLEISEKGIVEAEIVNSSTDNQQETAKKKRNRKIDSVVVGLIVILVATVVSILLTRNTDKESSAAVNNPELPTASPTLETVCVDEKLQEWVGLNTTLEQYFGTIMSTDLYKTISEDCVTEINAYTQSTEKSCQLEIEYNSSFNYGSFWLASTSVYKELNGGSDNGAAYLDGHYRLATILDTTVLLTTVFPQPKLCYADCYMGTGGRCDSLYTLAPTEGDNNPLNVTTWFVEPENFLSPQLYCNVGWEAVDQSYVDLKICAARSADIDLSKSQNVYTDTVSNDVYVLAYEAEKKSQQTCSQDYCGREFLQRRQCGKGKINSFVDSDTWLKQYFEINFMSDTYMIAAESCQKEIDAFTEMADTSCYLENQYNSSWNYGDRWLASSTNYAIMNQGSTNGAIYMDGNYMLEVVLQETFNFTIPIMKPRVCLADCYTGMTWNGDDDTCEFDKPVPDEFNPFGVDSLYISQSTISAEMYCNIEWENVDLAVIDIKICAAKAVGNPFLMTQDEYLCFFEYEKMRIQKCSEYYCDEDFSGFDITVEDYCQLSPDLLDTVYNVSGTDWI